tara:strand:+ start:4275 stop:4565 length:291 start_codon:yes stop_codon:yes gene_type:complete
MSHYTPLSDFLTERISLLYGALHQGSITFNTTDSEFTFNGTSIPYSDTDLDSKILELEKLISTYEEDEGNHDDLILYLEDIKTILIDTQDRLSWLQ